MLPADVKTILFEAGTHGAPPGGPLLLSLGGQNIPYSVLSVGSGFTTYEADISAFAGQVEELKFQASQGNNNFWEIDSIQFSNLVVPEPSASGIFCGGLALFVVARMFTAKCVYGERKR
jgi:hypothetical protein